MTQPNGGYRQDGQLRARIQAFSPGEPGVVSPSSAVPAQGRTTAAAGFGALLLLSACEGVATPGWVAIGVIVMAVIVGVVARNAQGFQPPQSEARRILSRGRRGGRFGGSAGGGGLFFGDSGFFDGGGCGDGGGSDGGGCGGGGE